MKLKEIQAAVTNPNKDERMARHEAVAALREHDYPNAAARRRQVRDWIREVNPSNTVDSIRSAFLNRSISKRTAPVRLGKIARETENFGNPHALIKGWRAERGRDERVNKPATPPQGVKTGMKGKREEETA